MKHHGCFLQRSPAHTVKFTCFYDYWEHLCNLKLLFGKIKGGTITFIKMAVAECSEAKYNLVYCHKVIDYMYIFNCNSWSFLSLFESFHLTHFLSFLSFFFPLFSPLFLSFSPSLPLSQISDSYQWPFYVPANEGTTIATNTTSVPSCYLPPVIYQHYMSQLHTIYDTSNIRYDVMWCHDDVIMMPYLIM